MTVIKKNYSDEEQATWKKVNKNKVQVFIYETKREFYAIPILIYIAVSSVLMAMSFGGWTLYQGKSIFYSSNIDSIYFMAGLIAVMIGMGIVFFIFGLICISWYHDRQKLYDEYQESKRKVKKTRNY